MTDKAFVLSVQADAITVMPMQKDSCAACTADCAKRTASFTVNNPRNLDIKPGCTVKLSASRKNQAVQALVSLLLPILSAVAGYFLAGPVCAAFGFNAGDGAKAAGVLILFLAASLAVFFLTRKFPIPGTPEIAEIL